MTTTPPLTFSQRTFRYTGVPGRGAIAYLTARQYRRAMHKMRRAIKNGREW